VEPAEVVEILFHALVYAQDARIADVTQRDDGVLLTTVQDGRTQAWVIPCAMITETVPAEDPS
jgi:hypothetical protein